MLADLTPAVWAETLKARRSVAPWVTLAAITLAALVGGFFMFVLKEPAHARSLGLLGAKAELTGGTADWAGYFALTAQIVAVGGLLVFGLVVVWLFGREFTDRTAKDLLALPTSRRDVVTAKLLVALGWCLSLTVLLLVMTFAMGALLGLPGWSAAVALRGVGTVLAAALLTATLTTTYGLVASVGRGYLAAVAAMFVTLLAAQVVSAVGYGAWFPWAVPSLLAGVAGPAQTGPGAAGVGSVLLVGLVSIAATVGWWERADQTR
ncbi:MAG: ABC transporter permease [Nocardioidaceae bacterium]